MYAKTNQGDSGFSMRCGQNPESVCDISAKRLTQQESMLFCGEVL